MGNIMKKLLKQRNGKWHNNKGMTFVEVICAVAIFALVSTTIGGIIVFCARTYQKGISETSVQQEAQFAANNIGNIVKDACSVQYGEDGGQLVQNGEDFVKDEDDNPRRVAAGQTELSFITNKQKDQADGSVKKEIQYSIIYDYESKALTYEEINLATSESSGRQIMAQNIKDFKADTTDFKDTRTVKLTMTVEDESTGREIPMAYTMTSRNEVSEDITFASSSNAPVIIFLESDVILVPGETYSIPISVVGKEQLTTKNLESGAGTTGVDLGSITMDSVELTVPKDTTAAEGYVEVQTIDKKEDGTPKASSGTHIRIRKVNEIKVTYAINSEDAVDGNYESKDTQFIFYANVSGTNLAKSPGSSWDYSYKRAQAVVWSYHLEVGGNTYEFKSDGTGGTNFTETPGIEQYITVVREKDGAGEEKPDGKPEIKEDVDKPSLKVRIMQDMPEDFVLTVTATSKHTDGVNKAGSKYPDDIHNVSGQVEIKPRETRIDGNEITLEPNETGEVLINMKGGRVTKAEDVSFAFHGATDLASDWNQTEPDFTGSGTKAKYDLATNTVQIKLGKDEMGVGSTYTFTIDVLIRGEKKSEITVHVRRLDQIWVQIIQDPNVAKTYDFRARLNVPRDMANDQATTKYLYDVMDDESLELAIRKQIVSQTLASRITWEYFDYSKDRNNPQHRDSVICMGGVGEKGAIIGSYSSEYDEYVIVNTSSSKKKESDAIKPARIEQDANGKWFIKQYPEIDLSLKDSSGKLAPNTELRVTIEMLHPQGTVDGMTINKTATAYHDIDIANGVGEWVVYASASIMGDNTRIVADGFRRAEECWFLKDGTFSDIRNYFLDVPGAKIGSFYRYSLAGKNEWTPYYLDDQNNWKGSLKLDGQSGSLLFMPGEEYDLDVVSVVYDENKKIIYWPLDSGGLDLLAAGTGWGPDLENFKLWDGTIAGKDLVYGVKDQNGNPVNGSGGSGVCTPKELYDIVKTIPHEKFQFRIPKTEMYFNKYTNSWNPDIITVSGKVQTAGSKSNPIHFQKGDRFAVEIEPTAFLVNAKKANFSALVMKDGQVLKDLDYNEVWSESAYGFYLNVHTTPYEMYNFDSKGKGMYELRVTLREDLSDHSSSAEYMRWKRIEGVLYNRKYVARTDEEIRNIPLYDETTGEGIIYFQID